MSSKQSCSVGGRSLPGTCHYYWRAGATVFIKIHIRTQKSLRGGWGHILRGWLANTTQQQGERSNFSLNNGGRLVSLTDVCGEGNFTAPLCRCSCDLFEVFSDTTINMTDACGSGLIREPESIRLGCCTRVCQPRFLKRQQAFRKVRKIDDISLLQQMFLKKCSSQCYYVCRFKGNCFKFSSIR